MKGPAGQAPSPPLAARHPIFKLVLAGGGLAAFLLLPDRELSVILSKVVLLGILFSVSGGISRRRTLLRGGLALFGFLAVFLIFALIGDALSGGDSLSFFLGMAVKSFWTLALSLLLFGSLGYRECVYLARVLRIPRRIAVQMLLVILIGRQVAREFARVPGAWKSRGLTAACLRRHPGRAAGLLTVVLLRAVNQGGRLETALIGRGFTGGLYTCFTASWKAADSLALSVFLLAGLGLFQVSAVL